MSSRTHDQSNERNISSILWDISYATYVSRVLGMLQGKWTIPILCAVRTQPVRLSELRRAIPTASKKALTASLRSLEAANVVVRRDLSGSVLHVEYELADTMREPLVTLLDHLAEWGELYELEAQPTVAPDIDSLTPRFSSSKCAGHSS
jgi:DNA-binding HxlR family transcriptional regulator